MCVWRSAPVPGTPEAVVPDRVFRATSTCFLWKPMSMSCRTMGSGGTGEAFCFFRRGGRTCCTVTGVEASLELLSSNRGEDGWVDSTARYWHTASAAAWEQREVLYRIRNQMHKHMLLELQLGKSES